MYSRISNSNPEFRAEHFSKSPDIFPKATPPNMTSSTVVGGAGCTRGFPVVVRCLKKRGGRGGLRKDMEHVNNGSHAKKIKKFVRGSGFLL